MGDLEIADMAKKSKMNCRTCDYGKKNHFDAATRQCVLSGNSAFLINWFFPSAIAELAMQPNGNDNNRSIMAIA